MSSFTAILQIGYWIGHTDDNATATGYCPTDYCIYQNTVGQNTKVSYNGSLLCVPHRRGQLCGECEEGYTVYYHSENFKCGECQYGAMGLLIYVIAELLPLVILFSFVMFLQIKMTSGVMQSILLFAQTVPLINHTPPFIPLSQSSFTLIRIHTFLLGFLNLKFFELSFCLWSGATVLDNLAFHYITTCFAILFLVTVILFIKHGYICSCCKNIMPRRIEHFGDTIIHSITTFLILPYTLYTVTSFQILSRFYIYGEGKKTLRSVVHLQGSVDYFGVDHLPYAIPAVFVLLFLSLPPPLLLISYPLLWKLKAKCKCIFVVMEDNDTTLWPIRKLLPLIDSFQGHFKDNRRMFAGFLLLWRVIIAATYAFSTNITVFYFLNSTTMFFFFTIHTLARPYKQRFYNMIDILMLGIMFLITILSWIIFDSSFDSNISQNVLGSLIGFKIFLMYLPLVMLAGIATVRLLQQI